MSEEKLIMEQIWKARADVLELNGKFLDAKTALNIAIKRCDDAEQAMIDFMEGNGIVKTEEASLSYTKSCNVIDVDAVPEQFIRVRTVKEPNKILINEYYKELTELPNWLAYETKPKLTIKRKG